MSAISSVLKFTARIGWIFSGSLAGFTLFGLILNILFFCLLPDRCATHQNVGAILSDCFDAVLVGLVFLPIFPILYAILGYRLAIQRSIYFAYTHNRDFLFRYIIDRFASFIQKNAGGAMANVGGLANQFFSQLDKLPLVWRGIINMLKNIIPMADIFDKIDLQKISSSTTNRDEIAKNIALEADNYLKSELLAPDKTMPLILISINTLLFVLLKWVF